MQNILNRLYEIEKEHPDFFVSEEKRITDYITMGRFSAGVFINADLPFEIIAKVRNAFDKIPMQSELE